MIFLSKINLKSKRAKKKEWLNQIIKKVKIKRIQMKLHKKQIKTIKEGIIK